MRIGIVGLGYVGLPLAVYLARHFPVIGFDVNKTRVAELGAASDRTGEVTDEEFAAARDLSFSADPKALGTAISTSSRCRPRSTRRSGPTSPR